MISDVSKLTFLNFLLLPIVLAIIYAIAYRFRDRHYKKNHPWRKYFIPALTLKIIGAIFIGLVFSLYYGGGDTYYFFYHSQVINSAMDESFIKWVNLLFHIPPENSGEYFSYISQMEWYSDPASYTVASITAFISVFTLNTYINTAVIFAAISFTGIWALFRTFAKLYPHLLNSVAIAILFIPSVFVWGSGIFKDTICIFGLGWLTYGVFRFLIQKDFSIQNIALAVMSFWLIASVKMYILMGFIPALFMWVLFNYSQKIKNVQVRVTMKVLMISLSLAATVFFLQQFSSSLGAYSLDKIAETSRITRDWILYMSDTDEGSGYDLGEFAPNVGGMLSKFPAAVNVTLFRPYIWESRKPIVLLSALEAFLFLFITLKVLVVVGLKKVWGTIAKDPTIQFCLVFSIIFAFAVGVSTYNFGALSRYKIPCMPFYAMAIILIYYKNMPLKKKLFRLIGI